MKVRMNRCFTKTAAPDHVHFGNAVHVNPLGDTTDAAAPTRADNSEGHFIRRKVKFSQRPQYIRFSL